MRDAKGYRTYGAGKSGKATKSDAGEAGELLVASDLLKKGLKVTKPLNRNGKDDLHAYFDGQGWRSIQVKCGRVYVRTGRIELTHMSERHRITSDILALVDLEHNAITYSSRSHLPLPGELF